MSAWAAGRPNRVEGRPLSPRAFRRFGIEAVVLGPATAQEGLVRREGVAIWRRLEAHAPLFPLASMSKAERSPPAHKPGAHGCAGPVACG